ncbi:MAG: hypothetical protein Q4B68_00965 [Bacteroidales bacterium]|nr:hypothetical protein [Bacteroidales bacterium]
MKRLFQRIFLVALLFATATVHAEESWLPIADEYGIEYFINESITFDDSDGEDGYLVWNQSIFKTKEVRNQVMEKYQLSETPYYEKTCMKFNYYFSRAYIATVIVYGASGKVLGSVNNTECKFTPVKEGSVLKGYADAAKMILEGKKW